MRRGLRAGSHWILAPAQRGSAILMPMFAEEDAKAQRSDVACPSHTVDAQEAAEQVLNSALRDPRAFAFDVTLRGAGDAEESIRRALL